MLNLKRKFLWILLVLIWFILICDFIALHHFLYWRFWWFDIIMHFLGGFWVALLSYYVFMLSDIKDKLSKINQKYSIFLISLIFVLGVGLIWELYELVFAFPLKPNYLFDTILDLIVDMKGWGVAYIFVLKKTDTLRVVETKN